MSFWRWKIIQILWDLATLLKVSFNYILSEMSLVQDTELKKNWCVKCKMQISIEFGMWICIFRNAVLWPVQFIHARQKMVSSQDIMQYLIEKSSHNFPPVIVLLPIWKSCGHLQTLTLIHPVENLVNFDVKLSKNVYVIQVIFRIVKLFGLTSSSLTYLVTISLWKIFNCVV